MATIAEAHFLDAKGFVRQYREHLSDFPTWEARAHAAEWLVFPENVGTHLSLDEVAISQGELYTVLTNKARHSKQGALVAIVKESGYKPVLLKQAAVALGLLGDKNAVSLLVEMLSEAQGLATQAAISAALGFIGDEGSIDPLVEMLENQGITASARSFAAVALGIVADKESLPWNAKIARGLNYRASTPTLVDSAGGTGILDIL